MRHDWDSIRALSLDLRRSTCGDRHLVAGEIVAALAAKQRIHISFNQDLPAGVLGNLMRSALQVEVSPRLSPQARAFIAAHELGHFFLHNNEALETRLVRYGSEEHGEWVGGYSPRERSEIQSNVFAAELLCPRLELRRYLAAGMHIKAAAAHFGVDLDLVIAQAVQLLRPGQERRSSRPLAALPSHSTDASPTRFLIEGPPGSGKTGALLQEVIRRLAGGFSIAQLCVLLRTEDLALAFKEALPRDILNLPQIWIGTPTGFAFEILSQFPRAIGRTSGVSIIDRPAALRLLQSHAPTLIPATIRKCLDDITRAKGHGAFYDEAGSGAQRSLVAPELKRLAKAYDEELRAANKIDLADAISMAAYVVKANPQVATHLRERFQHVFIDDVHELPRGAALLLSELAEAGCNVTAAAGTTAPLYSYRGAGRQTVAEFVDSVAPKRRRLGPRPQIADVAAVTLQSSTLVDARTVLGALIDNIRSMERDSIALRDQIILARSHQTLQAVATALQKMSNVPTFFIGDLWRRREIKLILSVLTLLDGNATSTDLKRLRHSGLLTTSCSDIDRLWRLAGRPVGLADVRRLCVKTPITKTGQKAFLRLSDHLGPLLDLKGSYRRAALFAFDGRRVAKSSSVPSCDDAVLFHFLQVCREHDETPGATLADLERRLQNLGSHGQDSSFHQAALGAVDAVRLCTIHQAGGQFWRAVHLIDTWQGRINQIEQAMRRADFAAVEAEEAVLQTGLTRATERLRIYPWAGRSGAGPSRRHTQGPPEKKVSTAVSPFPESTSPL